MEVISSFNNLLTKLLSLKTKRYFYVIKNNRQCFTGNMEEDIKEANKVIKSVESNNTGHVISAAFIYAFNEIYGLEFNPKTINSRSHEISKLTTRLTTIEIDYARVKLLDWIMNANDINNNTAKYIKLSRIRFYYVFEALLYTGMRIGELASINFAKTRLNRYVKSDISGHKYAEIIINTEKSCKKREIYLPENVYKFFKKDKYQLTVNYIAHTFVAFRTWAKLPFFISGHVLRRTKATTMYEYGVDEATISMVLGNTPDVVSKHYIISADRNFDACDIATSYLSNFVSKTNNIYWNNTYLARKE